MQEPEGRLRSQNKQYWLGRYLGSSSIVDDWNFAGDGFTSKINWTGHQVARNLHLCKSERLRLNDCPIFSFAIAKHHRIFWQLKHGTSEFRTGSQSMMPSNSWNRNLIMQSLQNLSIWYHSQRRLNLKMVLLWSTHLDHSCFSSIGHGLKDL